jgi:uncharacterized membrane protein HdeD (DUF308 family)
MNTARKPQSTNNNQTQMNSQTNKERNMKSKIIFLMWGMLFLLAGVVFLAGDYFSEEFQGAGFLFLCALGFTGVALWKQKNWWAIIPAGVFASLGLVVGLVNLIPREDYPRLPNTLSWGVYTWALFLGFSATFGVLWLLRKRQPTGWAIYPAIGLLALAAAIFILGSRFQEVWLVTMLSVTVGTLLLALLTRKRLPASQQAPHLKS